MVSPSPVWMPSLRAGYADSKMFADIINAANKDRLAESSEQSRS